MKTTLDSRHLDHPTYPTHPSYTALIEQQYQEDLPHLYPHGPMSELPPPEYNPETDSINFSLGSNPQDWISTINFKTEQMFFRHSWQSQLSYNRESGKPTDTVKNIKVILRNHELSKDVFATDRTYKKFKLQVIQPNKRVPWLSPKLHVEIFDFDKHSGNVMMWFYSLPECQTLFSHTNIEQAICEVCQETVIDLFPIPNF